MQKLNIIPTPDYQVRFGTLTEQSRAQLEAWVSSNISNLLDLGGAKRTVPVVEGLEQLAKEFTDVLIQAGYSEGCDSCSSDF